MKKLRIVHNNLIDTAWQQKGKYRTDIYFRIALELFHNLETKQEKRAILRKAIEAIMKREREQ